MELLNIYQRGWVVIKTYIKLGHEILHVFFSIVLVESEFSRVNVQPDEMLEALFARKQHVHAGTANQLNHSSVSRVVTNVIRKNVFGSNPMKI